MIKPAIKVLDDIVLDGFLKKTYRLHAVNREIEGVEAGLGYKFTSFHKKKANPIAALCDRYGSDKGEVAPTGHPYSWPSHSYADYYFRLFSHCRMEVRKVFECGLGTNNPGLTSSMGIAGQPGASLRVWRDYFPNARVYGADIDREVLFQDDRITTAYIDQLDPAAIAAFWQGIGETDFDLMVDDGLHTFEAGKCLFLHSIGRLRSEGVYVIEDVSVPDLVRFKEFFDRLDYCVDFVALYRPHTPLNDNNLVVVRKP